MVGDPAPEGMSDLPTWVGVLRAERLSVCPGPEGDPPRVCRCEYGSRLSDAAQEVNTGPDHTGPDHMSTHLRNVPCATSLEVSLYFLPQPVASL